MALLHFDVFEIGSSRNGESQQVGRACSSRGRVLFIDFFRLLSTFQRNLLAIAAVRKQVTDPPTNALNTCLSMDALWDGHSVVIVAIIDPMDPGLAKLHRANVATISDLR